MAVAEQGQAAAGNPPAEGAATPAAGAEAPDRLLDTIVLQWLPDDWAPALDLLAQYPLLMLPLVVAFGYLAGKLLQLILMQLFGRITKRTASDFDDRLLALGKRPALTTPVILALALFTAVVPMPAMLRGFTVGVLATVLLFSWLRALLKASHVMLEVLAARQSQSELIQPRTMPMFEISFKIVLVALAGYLLLLIWGVDPTAWLASAGVIGIAVGFAARDTLANLFSGLFIVADAPYKIGDFIVLDTGERGEVTHLGIRSTRLLTRDDVEVTIPNAIIANAKIINESGGPWEKHRIRLPVGVAYGSDAQQVVKCLEETAAANEAVLKFPEPRVRMRSFGESALNFELLCWIEKPVQRGLVLHELLMDVYERFRAAGIRIPFPQRDVHMINAPGA